MPLLFDVVAHGLYGNSGNFFAYPLDIEYRYGYWHGLLVLNLRRF